MRPKQLYWWCPWLWSRGEGMGGRWNVTVRCLPPLATWMSLTISGFLFSSCRPSNWHKTYRENPLPNLLSTSGQWYRLQLNTFVNPMPFPNPAETVNGPLPQVKHLPWNRTLYLKYANLPCMGWCTTCQPRTASCQHRPPSVRAHREPLLAIVWCFHTAVVYGMF